MEARPVPRDRRGRREGGRRHPADRQDAQGHRRRPPHLPRGRPRRRGRRRRHASPCTRAPPPSSTRARPTGRPSTKLKNTITGTPVLGNGDIWSADDALRMVERDRLRRRRRRPRLPRPAVAVRRPRRGLPRGAACSSRETSSHSARSPTPSAATPSCSSSSSTTRTAPAATSASTSPGTSRATRSAASCARARHRRARCRQLDDLLGDARLRSSPTPARSAEGQRGRAGSPKTPVAAAGLARQPRAAGDRTRAELTDGRADTSGG